MRGILTSLILLLAGVNLRAQIQSPVVHPDSTVTFSFVVPEADEVVLKGDIPIHRFTLNLGVKKVRFRNNIEMEQVNDTLWQYTSAPLEPDMYMYYYEVDGEEDGDSLDAYNPLVVRDIDHLYSAFIVPGGVANYYLDCDVPHGTINKIWYPSTIPNMDQRRMTIYLPQGYDSNTEIRYPVLYLLHGTGGDENAWIECGRAVQILDNMMSQRLIEPMIVVMPNSDIAIDAAPGESPYSDNEPETNNRAGQFGMFETTFCHDILSFVDTHYRTLPDKSHRAIAGLSLGGMQALYISANNPTLFDYIGLFSPQVKPLFSPLAIGGMKRVGKTVGMFNQVKSAFTGKKHKTDFEKRMDALDVYSHLSEKMDTLARHHPHLYYIAVGQDDMVKLPIDNFVKELNIAKIQYRYFVSGGGHTWTNWRRYLIEFLPKLFKQQ